MKVEKRRIKEFLRRLNNIDNKNKKKYYNKIENFYKECDDIYNIYNFQDYFRKHNFNKNKKYISNNIKLLNDYYKFLYTYEYIGFNYFISVIKFLNNESITLDKKDSKEIKIYNDIINYCIKIDNSIDINIRKFRSKKSLLELRSSIIVLLLLSGLNEDQIINMKIIDVNYDKFHIKNINKYGDNSKLRRNCLMYLMRKYMYLCCYYNIYNINKSQNLLVTLNNNLLTTKNINKDIMEFKNIVKKYLNRNIDFEMNLDTLKNIYIKCKKKF